MALINMKPSSWIYKIKKAPQDLLHHFFFLLFFQVMGNFWSLRWTSAQPVLVEACASSRLTVVHPFSALFCGPLFFGGKTKTNLPHRSLWGTSLRDWAPPHPTLHSQTPHPNNSPPSPQEGENSSHHGAVAKTKRRTVSASVSMLLHCICKQDETRHADKHVRFYTGFCFCVCMLVGFKSVTTKWRSSLVFPLCCRCQTPDDYWISVSFENETSHIRAPAAEL